MGFLVEKRDWQTDLSNLQSVLSNKTSINANNVFNIPVVSSSVDLITGIISMLDIGLYKQVRCDKVEEVEQDYRLKLLNNEPNYVWNSNQMKARMVQDIILEGSNYIYIDKNGNKVQSLYYVEKSDVTVLEDVTTKIKKLGKLMVGMEEYEPYNFIISTINSKNGLSGSGILKRNQELLKLAYGINMFLADLYKNKGNKRGIWSSNKMNPKDFDIFKKGIREAEADENNSYIVNGDDVKYNTMTSDAREMQTAEVLESIDKQIKAIFKIPTNIDTEEGYKSFIKLCITPYLNSIENAINKALLLESEKEDNYYFRFKLNELTRASIKERFEAYKASLESGIETINEIRTKEGLESIDGLDCIKFNLANVIFDIKTKQYWTPNTDARNDLNKKTGGDNNEGQTEKDKKLLDS